MSKRNSLFLTNEIQSKLKYLSIISPIYIYSDIIMTGFLAWFLFCLSITQKNFLYLCGSSFFMYRGHSLIHEVSHLRKKLKYYEIIYNVFFGIPNKIPAYAIRTHKFHHSSKTFSTSKDPEYERWTDRSALFLFRPAILSLVYPLFLIIRFGIWPLFSPFLPSSFSDYVYSNISSFVMNLKYIRPYNEKEKNEIFYTDLLISFIFILSLTLLTYYDLLLTYLLYWYIMAVFLFILNSYRALVSHRYQAHLAADTKPDEKQLIDSVTIKKNIFTELWAPIGLSYHSTHHFIPNIPYYNLCKVHSLLIKSLPSDHAYFSTIETSFTSAFIKLYRSCKAS